MQNVYYRKLIEYEYTGSLSQKLHYVYSKISRLFQDTSSIYTCTSVHIQWQTRANLLRDGCSAEGLLVDPLRLLLQLPCVLGRLHWYPSQEETLRNVLHPDGRVPLREEASLQLTRLVDVKDAGLLFRATAFTLFRFSWGYAQIIVTAILKREERGGGGGGGGRGEGEYSVLLGVMSRGYLIHFLVHFLSVFVV